MKYLLLILLFPVNSIAQNNIQSYRDTVADKEFLRRKKIIKDAPNIDDTTKWILLFEESMEFYNSCHEGEKIVIGLTQ